MTIKLLDYADAPVVHEIGDIEDIAKMSIEVITGDEILTVIYKDYTKKIFDSSNCRMADYYDDYYELYDFNNPEGSLLYSDKFLNRTDSYWHEHMVWDEMNKEEEP